MEKSLKKVGESVGKKRLSSVQGYLRSNDSQAKKAFHAAKVEALNEAYASLDGDKVDKAVKDMLNYLELTKGKDDPYYIQTKNHTFQANHFRILVGLTNLVHEHGYMPTTSQISERCGLSDETVYKHLKEFKLHPVYKEELDKIQLMRTSILSKMFQMGMAGDTRAARVYLYGTNDQGPRDTGGFHHNWIQINNLKVTPGQLENLPSDILLQIENLIKTKVELKELAESIEDSNNSKL